LLCFASCSVFIHERTVKYIKYTVAPSDTLNRIAKRFRVETHEIKEINPVEFYTPLKVGRTLKIPYYGQKLSPQDEAIISSGTIKKSVAKESSLKKVKLAEAKKYIGKLKWPLEQDGKVVSLFGRRWFSFHEGIDIAAPQGTAILAAHAGQVVYSGNGLKGYGNLVVVKAPGLLTVYGHNKKNRVRVGEYVNVGDHIADLGSTGKSSGPHLHFETRIKDDNNKNIAVDPMVFFDNT
jgi:murein DD-endopeptidase MepM/ murein hydrolase activator NlpD